MYNFYIRSSEEAMGTTKEISTYLLMNWIFKSDQQKGNYRSNFWISVLVFLIQFCLIFLIMHYLYLV